MPACVPNLPPVMVLASASCGAGQAADRAGGHRNRHFDHAQHLVEHVAGQAFFPIRTSTPLVGRSFLADVAVAGSGRRPGIVAGTPALRFGGAAPSRASCCCRIAKACSCVRPSGLVVYFLRRAP
jgi:hypothetical protein